MLRGLSPSVKEISCWGGDPDGALLGHAHADLVRRRRCHSNRQDTDARLGGTPANPALRPCAIRVPRDIAHREAEISLCGWPFWAADIAPPSPAPQQSRRQSFCALRFPASPRRRTPFFFLSCHRQSVFPSRWLPQQHSAQTPFRMAANNAFCNGSARPRGPRVATFRVSTSH